MRKGLLNRYIILLLIFSIGGFSLTGCKETDLSNSTKNVEQKAEIVEDENAEYEKLNVEKDGTKPVYYFYNQLSEEVKCSYDILLAGLMNGDESIRIETIEESVIQIVMQAILFDHPEIFWCNGAYQCLSYDSHSEILPEYQYKGDEKTSKIEDIEIATADIINSINDSKTDYEKIKSVYEYIINTVSYESEATDNQNIYSSLVNKKSVCAGYSRGIQYLLQKVGIECLYIEGNITDRGSHAWNIVKCEDKYYQLDATFGDDVFSNTEQSYEYLPKALEVNYSYLCCTDDQIYVNHQAQMPIEIPICNTDDLNYFKNNAYYYEEYSEQVLEDMKQAVEVGDSIWQCQFKSKQDYEVMKSKVEENVYIDFVAPYLAETKGINSCKTWYSYNDEMLVISCWYKQ